MTFEFSFVMRDWICLSRALFRNNLTFNFILIFGFAREQATNDTKIRKPLQGKVFLWGSFAYCKYIIHSFFFGMSKNSSPTLNYSESDHALIFVFQHQHFHMAHKVFRISKQSFASKAVIPWPLPLALAENGCFRLAKPKAAKYQ